MEPWTVAEMHELALAIVAAGDTFTTRRTLRRIERGELTVSAATARIRGPAINGPAGTHRSVSRDRALTRPRREVG
jgi:hypothetical protein